MLYAAPNDFQLVIPTVTDGTQPAAAFGASLIPGNNVYGAYVQLIAGASVTADVWRIDICINSGFVSAQARDMIVTIGIDPAGGSSYTDTINHLLCSCSGALTNNNANNGPVWFSFPLRISAGSSIAAKASINNVTVGTVRVFAELYCLPSRPEMHRVGSFVRTFGDTVASSSGTAVTPGTAAKGAFVQLGSALAEPLWFWEVGYGINSSTMTAAALLADLALGDNTNKKTVIPRAFLQTSVSEAINKASAGRFGLGAIGDNVYGRAQSSATPDANNSMIAYGVGG